MWGITGFILSGSTVVAHMCMALLGFIMHKMYKCHFLPMTPRKCMLLLKNLLTELSIPAILLFLLMVPTSVMQMLTCSTVFQGTKSLCTAALKDIFSRIVHGLDDGYKSLKVLESCSETVGHYGWREGLLCTGDMPSLALHITVLGIKGFCSAYCYGTRMVYISTLW